AYSFRGRETERAQFICACSRKSLGARKSEERFVIHCQTFPESLDHATLQSHSNDCGDLLREDGDYESFKERRPSRNVKTAIYYFKPTHQRIARDLRTKLFEIMVCAKDSPHEQLGHFHFSDACIAPVFKRNSKRRARECAARFNFQQMQTISKVKSAAVAALCESINRLGFREAKESRSG